ncbi:MAG: hypothetical protein V4499_00410 [Pseudomonadota bacterium]
MANLRILWLAACLPVSACDAWPTVVDNRSETTIHYQYHHKDYQDWSAIRDLAAGKATRLARAHYAEDIIGVRVREGAQIYELPPSEIDRLHKICSRSWLDHLTTGGDCWLTYRGEGQFDFSTNAPPGEVEVDALGNAVN